MSATAQPLGVTRPSPMSLAKAGGLVALGTTAATVVAGLILAALVDPTSAFQPLTVPSIASITIVYSVLATGVYGLVARRSSRPRTRWLQVGAVALALSLIPNLMLLLDPAGAPIAGVTVPNVVALVVLHFVAAPLVVFGLVRLAPVIDAR